MTKIHVPFNSWSKDKLKKGLKHATSRNKKYGNPGDTFQVEDKTYKLEMVVKLPLEFIAKELYNSEGCRDQYEFMKVWKDIHPRAGWTPDKMVWYHYFREVKK